MSAALAQTPSSTERRISKDLQNSSSSSASSDWVEYSAPSGHPDQPKLFLNTKTHEVRIGNHPHQLEQDSADSSRSPRKATQEPEENLSLFVVQAIWNVQKDMHRVLTHAQHLSTTICDNARLILSTAGKVEKELRQGGEKAVDERDDVQFLVDFSKLNWKFHDNPIVEKYRASTSGFDHASIRFTEWHIPQYLAESMPLREDADGSGRHNSPPKDGYHVKVILPIKDADGEPSEASLRVQADHSVKRVIAEAHAKAKVALSFLETDVDLGHADDYILKTPGMADYMHGDHPLLNYEYIRQQLRDNKPIELRLDRSPEPVIVENEDRYAREYEETVARSWSHFDKHRGQLVEHLRPRDPASITLLPPVLEQHHFQDLDPTPMDWSDLRYYPTSELHVPFRFELLGLEDCIPQAFGKQSFQTEPRPQIFLHTFLFHGMGKLRSTSWSTSAQTWSRDMTWRQQMSGAAKDTLISQLPREAKLAVILYAQSQGGADPIRLGWGVRCLHDESGLFLQGDQVLSLWPASAAPGKKTSSSRKRNLFHDTDFIFRATTRDNQTPTAACRVYLRFPSYEVPVVAPLAPKYRTPDITVVGGPQTSASEDEMKQLDHLINQDPLYELTPQDRRLIWRMRHHLVKHPEILPRFLQCVEWGSPEHRMEAHRLLNDWSPPENPVAVLELLDVRFPDYRVREYAVECLRRIEDDQLRPYLLQLTQCLKYEPYHNNPLVRFLLERGLANPFGIGHYIFWHLKSELHEPQFSERFAVILEEYLSNSGRHAEELRKQSMMCNKFTDVSSRVVQMKRAGFSDEDVKAKYVEDLERLNRDFFVPMKKFQIPYDPKLEATTLIVEKCRYMSSKMVPLWLVFKNADPQGDPIVFIFKSGDDLRQDILTLQILTIMDRIWLGKGIDMRMKPYKVISTGVNDLGKGVGLIEAVMNADTTSGIQLKYGGGALGALMLAPLDNFLRAHNKTPAEYDTAVDNFVRSCAGYCVACFVIGIADRHNGNIMITKDGHLFHIDFGHILGNWKHKFHWKRERAAFVFTPEMAYVMGGKSYQKSKSFHHFLQMCFKGYQVLRQNAVVLENLLILMIGADMPELQAEIDIHYLRDMLVLDLPKKAAEARFHAEIKRSLATIYRRFDNALHILKHKS